ncbi:PorV/PorQ family protein [Gracilimonas mengyeensis]|nr:PorV/PorQ family protein [Gracilimonas mengyeensis]
MPSLTMSTNIKTTSLANANVAAVGELSDVHINPAGIGMAHTVEIIPILSSFGINGRMTGANLSTDVGRLAIALTARKMDTGGRVDVGFGQPQLLNYYVKNESILNGAVAYSITDKFRLGLGINYIRNERKYFRSATEIHEGMSFDFGLILEMEEFENNSVRLKPSFGFSLTDFGKGIRYNRYKTNDPLPTTLRLGASLDFETTNEIYDQKLIRISLLSGISKIIARQELKENSAGDTVWTAMNPFKALFNSWDTFHWREAFFSQKGKAILAEQIWLQGAFEVKVLETFALRMGYEKAAKRENLLSKITFGAGIDLYYLNIDYAWLNYVNDYSAEDYSYELGHHLQLTARIPLDGHKPDSILNHLFK